MKPVLPILAAALLLLTACGGDNAGPDLDLSDRLTQQAGSSSPAATPAAPTQAATQPAPQPTAAPTRAPFPTPDAATALQVRTLSTFVLTQEDLPAGYIIQNEQAAFRDAVIAAQGGIPPLAAFLTQSSLQGSWAALFTNEGPPPLAQNAIIYLFAAPADAQGFVDASFALEAGDYLGSTSVEKLTPPAVGDRSALVRFNLAQSGSLELTWAQGPMAGQLILRFPAGQEPATAVADLTALAAIQAARMVSFLP